MTGRVVDMNKKEEFKQKAKSFKFWIKGFIDSIFIGGISAVVAGLGLAGANTLDSDISAASPKMLLVLFLSGALTKLGEFWVRNPLTSIA